MFLYLVSYKFTSLLLQLLQECFFMINTISDAAAAFVLTPPSAGSSAFPPPSCPLPPVATSDQSARQKLLSYLIVVGIMKATSTAQDNLVIIMQRQAWLSSSSSFWNSTHAIPIRYTMRQNLTYTKLHTQPLNNRSTVLSRRAHTGNEISSETQTDHSKNTNFRTLQKRQNFHHCSSQYGKEKCYPFSLHDLIVTETNVKRYLTRECL